jgi:hypothetical protein
MSQQLSEEEKQRREDILGLLDRVEAALDEGVLTGEMRFIVQAGLKGIENSLTDYDEKGTELHLVKDDDDEVL